MPCYRSTMRQYLFHLAVVLVLLQSWAVRAAALPDAIEQARIRAGLPEGQIGLVIQDVARDTPDLVFGERRSFNPASVMKLVTTLAALDNLGPAHTFKTQILTEGSLADGVLYGNLILRGGGDPALSRERFWSLLREIRSRGIREIRGDVIIDNTFFAIEASDPAGFDDAPLKPYNAAPTALLVNFNVLSLQFRPWSDGVGVSLDPSSLPIDNRVTLDRSSACNGWPDRLAMTRDGDQLRLSGAYPLACGDRATWVNLMCPAATVAVYFKDTWRDLGGSHLGQVRVATTPDSASPLFEFESPALSEIVRDINKYSNNVMAKMLYLDLGAARYGGAASWDKSDRAMHEWLGSRGLEIPELVLENGCGLSRIERISAASMARLLLWAARQPLYYEFAASMPALGQEGTQKKRLNGTPETGRGWLKSGSLEGVRNLAGYVLDASGRRKVVVLFINHPAAANAEAFQAAVLRHAMSTDLAVH